MRDLIDRLRARRAVLGLDDGGPLPNIDTDDGLILAALRAIEQLTYERDAAQSELQKILSAAKESGRPVLIEAIRSKLPNGRNKYGIDWTTVMAEAAGKPRPYGDGTFNAAEVLAIQHCVGDSRIVKFTVANGTHPDSQN